MEPISDDAVDQICRNGLVSQERAVFSDDHRVVLYTEDDLEIDHFAVYRLPIPEPFQKGGTRTIRVTLAFDPPVRRTRADYMGTRMSFRLLRGCEENFIFEHFRKRTQDEESFPELPGRLDCGLKPGSQKRELNSVQTASVTFSRDTVEYGSEYFLVVRCHGGWAAEQEVGQGFAVVVELEHQSEIQLYAQLQAQLRV